MNTLLETIRSSEVELHHPGVRCNAERLEQLLHPDFHEVGRSGHVYDRALAIRFLSEQTVSPSVAPDEFRVTELAPDVALLTYRSAHRDEHGRLINHTHRSSLWMLDGEHWRLRYHQGTPAATPW